MNQKSETKVNLSLDKNGRLIFRINKNEKEEEFIGEDVHEIYKKLSKDLKKEFQSLDFIKMKDFTISNAEESESKDVSKIIKVYEQSSEYENSSAINYLGYLYYNGEGVEKDISKTIELYEKASKLNNSHIMNNLALLYYNGEGVPKDISKAIELYEKSSKLGDKDAIYLLQIMKVNIFEYYLFELLNKNLINYETTIKNISKKGNKLGENIKIGLEKIFENKYEKTDKLMQIAEKEFIHSTVYEILAMIQHEKNEKIIEIKIRKYLQESELDTLIFLCLARYFKKINQSTSQKIYKFIKKFKECNEISKILTTEEIKFADINLDQKTENENKTPKFFENEQSKNDKTFVLKLLENESFSYLHISENLKNDKEVALKAVGKNGLLLGLINEKFQIDKEIVLKAVSQNGLSLYFANDEFKNDKDIVLTAVSQDGLSLEYASKKFKNDRTIVLKAVLQNDNSLQYSSDNIKNDKEFINTILKETIKNLKQKVEDHSNLIENLKKENGQLNNQVEQHINLIENLKTENGQFNNKVEQQTNLIENLKTENELLNNKVENLKTENEEINKKIENQKQDIEIIFKILKVTEINSVLIE